MVIGWLVVSKHWSSVLPNIANEKFAVVWSGIFGAVIAAAASWLTIRAANSNSLERLKQQHSFDASEAAHQRLHDSAQKHEDRKAAIRREIYVHAVERTQALLGAVAAFPDRPLSAAERDSDAVVAFLTVNAKVWLVADPEAAHLSRDLARVMTELHLRALVAALPLRRVLEEVRTLSRRIDDARKDLRRVESRLADLRGEKSAPDARSAAASAVVEANDWLKTLTAERDRQQAAAVPDRVEFFRAITPDIQRANKALVEMVCLLRRELGLPADGERFMAQLDDSMRHVADLFDGLEPGYRSVPASQRPE